MIPIKKLPIFCYLLIVLILFSAFPVFALGTGNSLFTAELIDSPAKQGDSFSVAVTSNRKDIAAFVLRVKYDPSIVTQVSAELSDAANKDYMTFLDEDGIASLVYTAADSKRPAGGVVLRFRTDSTCPAEALPLRFEITDAASSSAEKLLSKAETHMVAVSFPPLPSSDSTLLSLTPPAGTLTPDFDPNIYEYTLEVPFSYTSLVFDAVPVSGAAVRVNRKNLSAGGSTVDFHFTVTAADGRTKTVYTVAVTRLEKSAASSDNSASGKQAATHSEGYAAGATDTLTENADAASPIIYIYPERETNPTVDRLVTAAIVLFSVCVGVCLACFLHTYLSKTGKHSNNGHDKESQ